MNHKVTPTYLTYKPLAYAILVSLTASLPAIAEETKTSDKNDEKLVVVAKNTALKIDTPEAETPRSVSEVTQEEIAIRGARKIDEALSYSSGIRTGQYGADNRTDWLIIRGFEWAPYQNGLSSIYNEAGFYSWHQETYGVERIDALKGPASMLYGQNPPGGLVNVITKHPTRIKQGEIDVSYGSNDYRHFGIDTSGPIDEENRVLYRFVGFAKKDNGPVDGASSERYYVAPSISVDFNDQTSLTLMSSYMKDNANPTSGFKLPYGTLHNTPFGKVDKKTSFGEPSYSTSDSEQFNISYELSHMFNDTWSFKQNTSYNYLNLLLRNVYGSYMVDDRNVERGLTYRDGSAQNYAIDNRLVGNWTIDRFENTLLLGTDYSTVNSRGQDGNIYSFGHPLDVFSPVYGNYMPVSDNQLFSHHTKRFQTGLYVQNQLKFDDSWLLLLGGRYDKARSSDIISNAGINSGFSAGRLNMNDHRYTKSAGLMYLGDNRLNPYISYSESFQPLSGRNGYGNPYKPQSGQQTEVGVKYVPEGFNGYFNAALFELYQKNILTTSNDPKINYAQVQTGMARSRGLELEGVGHVTDALQLHASYTLDRVETIRSGESNEINNRLPLTPLHMASLWADYSFNGKLEGFTIGSGVRYIGSTYGDKTGNKDLKVPAYTLWDAMVRYDINKQWQVQVNARNLADKNYVSGCNYWCYYGEGRTVTANMNYSW